LLFVLGYILKSRSISSLNIEKDKEAEIEIEENTKNELASQRKKRRSVQPRENKTDRMFTKYIEEFMGGLIIAFILIALGYDFISGSQGGTSAFEILWNSLVKLKGSTTNVSYGVLTLIITTWMIGSVVIASEISIIKPEKSWGRTFGSIAGISFLISSIFWIWHSLSIFDIISKSSATIDDVMRQIQKYEGLITRYYIFVFALVLISAFIIYREQKGRLLAPSMLALSLAPIGLIAGIFIIGSTNLKIIQADIDYKLADPFTKGNSWPVAIKIYDRALSMAPNEDFYYLFLGRAYLEYGKTITDNNEQEKLITQAQKDLEKAQQINPLNTDHTANLARLFSMWSSMTEDSVKREEHAQKSDYYFSRAIVLSPNNSRLWGEWALLALNSLDQPDKALERLNHSLELDPTYDWTNALLGEYYMLLSQKETVTTTKQAQINQSLYYYSEAKRLARDQSSKINYSLGMAQLYINTQQYNQAIETLEEVIQLNPTSSDLWRYEQSLAQLYYQVGNYVSSIAYAQRALTHAPEEQKDTLQNFISQLQNIP